MQQFAKKLHKPVIKRFEKWKVHSSVLDDIWGADLADMKLIRTFNKRFQFLIKRLLIQTKEQELILM